MYGVLYIWQCVQKEPFQTEELRGQTFRNFKHVSVSCIKWCVYKKYTYGFNSSSDSEILVLQPVNDTLLGERSRRKSELLRELQCENCPLSTNDILLLSTPSKFSQDNQSIIYFVLLQININARNRYGINLITVCEEIFN